MKIIIQLSIVILLVACSSKKVSETQSSTDPIKVTTTDFDYDAQFELENYLVDDVSDTSKVQIVNDDCAILIYPTKEQIEEMKKTEGEDDFYVGADDSNFYQAQASMAIDSVGVKLITVPRQFVKLIGEQESWTLDIRKKNLPAWNLIFFNKTKSPLIVPTISLTTDKIREYFEIKK